MFAKNAGFAVKSSSFSLISKRFINTSGKSQSTIISDASTSKLSPNSEFGDMQEELKAMKKDIKNASRDFPNVREKSRDDDSRYARDTNIPSVGASEVSADSYNERSGRREMGDRTSSLNDKDYGDMNQGSYRSEEAARKARLEDSSVHKAESVVVDTIDKIASKSAYADGKKSEHVGDGIFGKFSEGIKKAQNYMHDVNSPEYYAKRHSQVARDFDAKEAAKLKEEEQKQYSAAAGDHERSEFLNNPRKVETLDEMNWGQENTATESSAKSASSKPLEDQTLASQTMSGISDAAHTIRDAAKGAFEKAKDTINDLTSSKKQ